MRKLREWLERQHATPGPAGLLVSPFYLARRGLYASMQRYAPELNGRLLDIGCGTRPYAHLFGNCEYVALELDTESNRRRGLADYYYDGRTIPFADASFDALLCNQVLEHVFEPAHFVAELARILRPGGQLLLTVPFCWDEHEQPHDYARYSSFGLAYLLRNHSFDIVAQEKLGHPAEAIAQLWNGYLYKLVHPLPRGLRLLLTTLLMAPVSLLGRLLAAVLPSRPDLYLDNLVLARRRDDSNG